MEYERYTEPLFMFVPVKKVPEKELVRLSIYTSPDTGFYCSWQGTSSEPVPEMAPEIRKCFPD